jgi:hypothetical protein
LLVGRPRNGPAGSVRAGNLSPRLRHPLDNLAFNMGRDLFEQISAIELNSNRHTFHTIMLATFMLH